MIVGAYNTFVELGTARRRVGDARLWTRRLAALACVAAAVAASPVEAAAPVGKHGGGAFGARAMASAGPVAAGIGTIAHLPFPCTGTDGVKQSELASAYGGLNGAILRANSVLSTVQTIVGDDRTTDETTSRLEGVTALGGVISADAILAVSRTTATASKVRSDDVGATFVNLKIASRAVDPDVAPNTPFDLPGLGVATLKQERRRGDGRNTSGLTVEMISIRITSANAFGLPVGATMVLGHAASNFQRGAFEVAMNGSAYVSQASSSVPSVLSAASGATALQSVGCLGTDGETLTEDVTGLSIEGVAAIGAGRTKAFGEDGVARTSARLLRVSALGGLITAGEVKAVAQTSLVGARRVRSTKNSGVSGLKILGLPVAVALEPNTEIALPGIGYVIVNEQIVPDASSDDKTVVNALRIVVTKRNRLGLPVGSNIVIGHAAAGVQRVSPGV